MRTEAMIDALNKTANKGVKCEECIFDCKPGSGCMLVAIAKKLKTLQNGIVRAQQLMRKAVQDLKAHDTECDCCRHHDVVSDKKWIDEHCANVDLTCKECPADCPCKHCDHEQNNWEWNGYAE